MDFMIADSKKMELGFLPSSAELDIDLSRDTDNKDGCNDAQLTVPIETEFIAYGSYIFCPGTEYGGRVLELKRTTDSPKAVWYLDTWRRMLGQAVIEPPQGEAYLNVSGDANTVIRNLISVRYGGFFSVSGKSSGIAVSGRFDRYVTVLDGLNKLLESCGARLKIQAVQGAAGKPFEVLVEAVRIADYSEEIEYSQDNKLQLTIKDCRRGINHLLCLGKGELQERMVRHLYVQADGSIGREQFFKGIDCREAVFDHPNAEDEAELLRSGEERLRELMNYKKMELSVKDTELEIGDIVAGRDRVSGMYLSKPVVGKILKIKNGRESVSYKVKGDD